MAEQTTEMASATPPAKELYEKPEGPNDSPLGVLAPFPYSPEPFAELSEKARNTLLNLDNIATKTDVAARRLEVEQAWESLHFDRGYQHLLRGRQGGWQIPGPTTGFGGKQQLQTHGLYDTNVYGSKGDIICAALAREVPKQEFFPKNPDWQPDIIAAEEAERFKQIWARNNNLHALLTECARIFWNEDRVLLWTRYELNGQKYGFEEEEPTLPLSGDELSPFGEPTGQEGQTEAILSTTSPAEENVPEAGDTEDTTGSEDTRIADTIAATARRKPLGREVTSAHGKLDHKVPIAVDDISKMGFVQLSFDLDVTEARATFPWIADKIKPGSDGNTEAQLDRIARENVRQAVLGAYVTGDSLERHCTVKYTWFRPSYFLDKSVEDDVKAELMEAFPDGCLLGRAGTEFAFARNEKMDDHLAIAHPIAGKGQNRRAMGSSLISIQKRINDWVDLLDDFFKRTVPKKWMNSDAFDVEALKTQPNVPGSTGPFLPQPGLTSADQYILVEPSPQPQSALPDFIKWFITNLSEDISGALPSLFGANTNTDTVGGIAIQRDQALQRVGCPWNYLQDLFAESARQAVKAAAECREGKVVTQHIPELGNVSVNTANLAGGDVLCFAESNPAFPESAQQKAIRLETLVDKSTQNPAISAWIFSPTNLPELAEGLRLKNFKVQGAASVTKQKGEFDTLLKTGPMPNPALVTLQQQYEQMQQQLAPMLASGQQLDPKFVAQGHQLEQQMASMPPQVSTVTVAQDESEDHMVEAATCFDWMNGSEGQKFKYGTVKQQAGFANVHLHWSEHVAMAKKIAAANAQPPKPPSESISAAVDKVPTPVAIQLLAKMGVQATPKDFDQHATEQLNAKVQAKVIPEALKSDHSAVV